ncbi:MAG: DUF1501 domain-containing protein [Verrucomicrobiales bacterium]|nr:DUF1501 domain-containing protein [Verrucomicrobiales bacterium]
MKPFELRTRRDFLKRSIVGGALTWTVPTFLARTFRVLGAESEMQDGARPRLDAPVLVLLQLAGGNDGLNTVVPWTDDHYRRARPKLGLTRDQLLPIDDRLAFPLALSGFRDLVEEGHLAVVHGVGYPNPNRSHFRSMEIWQTAVDADRVERRGWIGRYFDCCCQGADPTVGVSVGRQMPQAFQARRPIGVSVEESFRSFGHRPEARGVNASLTMDDGEMVSGESVGDVGGAHPSSGEVLDFLDRTALDARLSEHRMREIAGKVSNTLRYPETALGQSLSRIAQWIAGRLPTQVYFLSHGGFDTHRGQAPTHERLLRELGDGMKSFVSDLRGLGVLNRVLVMAFSEFGRRVEENASGGTDHGAAGPVFFFGPRFRKLWVGRHPSLAPDDLVRGDLRHSIDFRSVYAEALEGWLGASSEKVLGRRFERIGLV